MFLFAVEGISGMLPAIYTDTDFTGTRCDFSRSDSWDDSENDKGFLVAQILLSTLCPYLIPFATLAYPLVKLSGRFLDMTSDPIRFRTRNVLLLAWSHIFLSLPWALHALVMLPMLQGWSVGVDTVSVCIMDGLFRAFLETWFLLIPLTLILGDPSLVEMSPWLSLALNRLPALKFCK